MATASASPLKIIGEAVPPSVSEVAKLGFHQSLMTALQCRRLVSPMPLQKNLWPIVIRGRSVVCVSKPKSGKTMGYMLPLLSRVIETEDEKSKAEENDEYGPIALMLVSSPKIAEHLGKVCNLLVSSVENVKCVILHEEVSERVAYSSLLNGCSILISTPDAFLKALLLPHLHRHTFTNLRRLSHLIIDDADTLLSKYKDSVKEILREVGSALASRQNEGAPSAGIQFIAVGSDLTKDVEDFYRALSSYQPIMIK